MPIVFSTSKTFRLQGVLWSIGALVDNNKCMNKGGIQ